MILTIVLTARAVEELLAAIMVIRTNVPVHLVKQAQPVVLILIFVILIPAVMEQGVNLMNPSG